MSIFLYIGLDASGRLLDGLEGQTVDGEAGIKKLFQDHSGLYEVRMHNAKNGWIKMTRSSVVQEEPVTPLVDWTIEGLTCGC